MSDPIRSISQNNFILADQKEVSHDNTLSGNGTAASPLGVSDAVMVSSKLDITNNKITGYDGTPIGGGSTDTWTDVTSSISSVKSGIKMYYNSALKIVCVCGQYSHSQPSGNPAWVTCGTIASGYRPKANLALATCITDTDFFISKGYINTGGVIRVMVTQGNITRTVNICATYCVS